MIRKSPLLPSHSSPLPSANGLRRLQIGAVLALFGIAAFLFAWRSSGDDLSSSYVGCRVVAAGQLQHLYSIDARAFDRVDDPVWKQIAGQTGFPATGILHPYVQTPLWALSLEPLCTRTRYRTFQGIFLALEIGCFSAFLWTIAVNWTPSLFHPGWMVLIALVFYTSDPVRYALTFAQTHILYILLTILALQCDRKRPVLAGALLALAAAVKITPAYFFLYWLILRRWKPAASFAATSALLVAVSTALLGWPLFDEYLHVLSGVSNVLLVSYNNQSFPAAMMSHAFPSSEMIHWTPHLLPPWLKMLTSALAVASTVVGGWLDRRSPDRAPLGAIFALVGVTVFTPIAWTHYFFILIIPVMVGLEYLRSSRPYALLAALALICVLNLVPHRAFHYRLRSRTCAAVLSMAVLFDLGRRYRGEGQRLLSPSPAQSEKIET